MNYVELCNSISIYLTNVIINSTPPKIKEFNYSNHQLKRVISL